MSIADKITVHRKRLGLTQEELAEKLSVSRQAVSRWEMGTAVPDAANLLNVSRLFKVTVDYLINDAYNSETDLPVVQKAEKTVSETYKRKINFIILIGIQVFAFLAQCFSIGLALIGYTAAFLILFFCAITIQLVSMAAFEIVFRRYDDCVCRKERKKYYRISVWLFAFFPIIIGIQYFEFVIGNPLSYFMPYNIFRLICLIVYLSVCGIVTLYLRDKKPLQV